MATKAQTKRTHDSSDDNDSIVKRQNIGSEPLLKLLVPNYIAGALIGKGGEALTELQTQYGGFVRLSPGREYYPGTNERIVVVSGEKSALTNVNSHILDKFEDPGRDETMKDVPIIADRAGKVMIVLTDLAAGLLIGRGGETIKAIQEESQAKLSITMPEKAVVKGERVLTIIGPKEQLKTACEKVIEKVSGDASNMANTRMKYESSPYMDSITTGYESVAGVRGDSNTPSNSTLPARVTIDIDVDEALVGPIMGKQGIIVKEMVQRSGGARFKFSDKTEENVGKRTLTISGDFNQASNGYLLLNERVAQIDLQPQRR